MKSKILFIAFVILNVQNIICQETETSPSQNSINEVTKINKSKIRYGDPYIQGPKPLNMPNPDFEQTGGINSGGIGKPAGPETMEARLARLEAKSAEDKTIRPHNTRLSEISSELTGEYETIVPGDNNSLRNKENKPSVLVMIGIVMVVLIVGFVGLNKNKKEPTEILEEITTPEKIVIPREINTSKVLAELEKLQSLRKDGAITEEEFEQLKKNIIG